MMTIYANKAMNMLLFILNSYSLQKNKYLLNSVLEYHKNKGFYIII
jgi:hypothetical protein